MLGSDPIRKIYSGPEGNVSESHCSDSNAIVIEEIFKVKNTEYDHLQAHCARLEQSVQEIKNSFSWKLTKPLRLMVDLCFSIRRKFWFLLYVIRVGGGLAKTIKAARDVFVKEGIAGIKLRLKNVEGLMPLDISSAGTMSFGDGTYVEWICRYDTLNDVERYQMKCKIAEFEEKPLISVIVPVFNPKIAWLKQAIESVRNQIYEEWELCIADDCSTNPEVKVVLEDYCKIDSRIKVEFRSVNGHISAASNTALSIATGAWAALLDHDDVLPDHALFYVADTIIKNKNCALIYSDEDKINESGLRSSPYFKCGWNRDLFYSHNLISHLGVFRMDVLREIGGFRTGYEGSQDYDLALRAIERLNFNQIIHIPKVLYHWRIHSESTASGADAKPYAMLAGERAINDHFRRLKINAQVKFVNYGYQVKYDLPAEKPKVSILVVGDDDVIGLKRCIESVLRKTEYENYQIVVVVDPDEWNLKRLPFKYTDFNKVKFIFRDYKLNSAAEKNRAVDQCDGDVIVLLNSNIEVIKGNWLSEMVSHAIRPEIGAVGAKIIRPDDTYHHCGIVLGINGLAENAFQGQKSSNNGYFGRAALTSSYSAVSGDCLAIRKSIFRRVNGLDENELLTAFGDVDFCLKVKTIGYRNLWLPSAVLRLLDCKESQNDGFQKELINKDGAIFSKRWEKMIKSDAAYSPNLTNCRTDFTMAWPPRINATNNEIN